MLRFYCCVDRWGKQMEEEMAESLISNRELELAFPVRWGIYTGWGDWAARWNQISKMVSTAREFLWQLALELYIQTELAGGTSFYWVCRKPSEKGYFQSVKRPCDINISYFLVTGISFEIATEHWHNSKSVPVPAHWLASAIHGRRESNHCEACTASRVHSQLPGTSFSS